MSNAQNLVTTKSFNRVLIKTTCWQIYRSNQVTLHFILLQYFVLRTLHFMYFYDEASILDCVVFCRTGVLKPHEMVMWATLWLFIHFWEGLNMGGRIDHCNLTCVYTVLLLLSTQQSGSCLYEAQRWMQQPGGVYV